MTTEFTQIVRDGLHSIHIDLVVLCFLLGVIAGAIIVKRLH